MKLQENPYIQAELENIQIQFGNKSLLTMEECCEFFSRKGTAKPERYIKNLGIECVTVGKRVFVKILDLAKYMAQKKASQEGMIIVQQRSPEAAKNNLGFRKAAIQRQLTGNH